MLSLLGFPDSSVGKESTCNARDPGSIPESGRSSGEGIDYSLQNPCFPAGSDGKESTCNAEDPRPQFNFWVGKNCWRRDRLSTPVFLGFSCGSTGKQSAWNADGSIPGSWRSTREEKGYPLQYSFASLVAELVIYLQRGRPGIDPWVGKILWRRAWQPTPVFLPGESPWTEEPGRL